MRCSLILTSLLGSALALALPSPQVPADHSLETRNSACMSDKVAQELVGAYERLVGDISESDYKYLSDSGFTDTSDSINVLIGKPLGAVTFPSKEAFIAAQTNPNAPPQTPVTVTEYVVACDSLAVVWTASRAQPVKGISLLKAAMEKGQWSFTSFKVEFNSLTWSQTIPSRTG